MEKYGVEINSDKIKLGENKKPTCPSCGHSLNDKTGAHVSHCPECGTEPFENKKSSTDAG